MNQQQYQRAVERLIDRDCPDIHMEVLLLFGASPDRWSGKDQDNHSPRVDWRLEVRKFLTGRHRFKRGSHTADIALDIIERRIEHELARYADRQD